MPYPLAGRAFSVMTYKETVNYLFNVAPVFEHVGASAYKEGLENTQALDKHFGFPHRCYKTIHIAGTNGKGSCSHSIAAILQSAGWKVGLYTSPHLVDFRERIRVNGVPIPEKRVVDFVEQERKFFEPLHPSFFELTTALAFLYFKEQKVDVAVIEVGLGGRLDCTNIISPELSIITNISFDHTQFLGNTLAKIAGEKAGIIKPHIPVVIGEDVAETRPVFESKAQQLQAPITFAQDNPVVSSFEFCPQGGLDFNSSDYGRLHCELGGSYQEKNINTIFTALRKIELEFNITAEAVSQGLSHVCELTGLRGRWESLHHHPHVVCDTGHNAGGWQYLTKQIKAQHCATLRIVFGMVDDKDISTVMEMLPKNAVYYWAQATSKRAFPSDKVAEIGKAHGLTGTNCGSVEEAYRHAMTEASPDDFIFVGGSSYIVADLLAIKNI